MTQWLFVISSESWRAFKVQSRCGVRLWGGGIGVGGAQRAGWGRGRGCRGSEAGLKRSPSSTGRILPTRSLRFPAAEDPSWVGNRDGGVSPHSRRHTGPQPLQVCRGCTRVGSPKTQLLHPEDLRAVNAGERRRGVHRLPLTAGSSPAAEPPRGPPWVPPGRGRQMHRWAPAPLPFLVARPEASAPPARVVLKRRQQNRAVNFPAISYSGNVSSPRKPRPAGLIKSSN